MNIVIRDMKGQPRGDRSLDAARRAGFEKATSWPGTDLVAISYKDIYSPDTADVNVPLCQNDALTDKCILIYGRDGVDDSMLEEKDVESNRVAWINHAIPRSGLITEDVWKCIKRMISREKDQLFWKENTITLDNNHDT